MDIRKLQRAIVDGLEDVKAQNIVVFNTEHHVAAVRARDHRLRHQQPTDQGPGLQRARRGASRGGACRCCAPRVKTTANGSSWTAAPPWPTSCSPAIRDYYRLEEIWGAKPVKMKLGDERAQACLPKASGDEADFRRMNQGQAARKTAQQEGARRKKWPLPPGARQAGAKPGQSQAGRKAADEEGLPAPKKPTAARKVTAGAARVQPRRLRPRRPPRPRPNPLPAKRQPSHRRGPR